MAIRGLFVVLAASCSGGPTPAPVVDAGPDSAPPTDAGDQDAALIDGGTDARLVDSGAALDARVDAAAADAPFDAARADAPVDARPVDAATDAAPVPCVERISLSTAGLEPNSGAYIPSLSFDGQLVAFSSSASNLDPMDNVSGIDVFLRDRSQGTTTLLTRPAVGVSDGDNTGGRLSADGSVVVFGSNAPTITGRPDGTYHDIMALERSTHTFSLVSVGTPPGPALESTRDHCFSPDARFVGFTSRAANLVTMPADTNGVEDVFLRDRMLGTLERISVKNDGAQAMSPSSTCAISADGRFVAFTAESTLAAADTDGVNSVYVRDRVAQATLYIGPGMSPAMSSDGRYVAFSTSARLVASDTDFSSDIYLLDRVAGTTERVSVATGGGGGNSTVWYFAMSADARFIAFKSGAANLDPADTDFNEDIFVRDRVAGVTRVVTRSCGTGHWFALFGPIALSGDGRWVGFGANWSMVPGDSPGQDIFVTRNPLQP